MTTNTLKKDGRWIIRGCTAGPLYQKTAVGGDAISASHPRSSYPKQWNPKGYSNAKLMDKYAKRLFPPQQYDMSVTDVFESPRKLAQYPIVDFMVNGPPPTNPNGGGGWATGRILPPSADYRVLANLRNKLYGSSFNLGVTTAEGKRAVTMIGDSAFRIRLALSSLMHKDWRGLVAALNVDPKHARKIVGKPGLTLSQRWLELQYGWKPLLKDTEDGAKWIAAQLGGGTQEKHPVLRASIDPIIYTDYRVPGDTSYVWGSCTTRFDLSYRVYAWRKSPAALPSLYTVAQVGWELLPYSFIVDWFIPIGAYIDALRTASDIDGLYVRSLKTTFTWSNPRCGKKLYDYGFVYPFLPPKREEVLFTRTVTNGPRVPTPEFVGWREVISLKRAANAVALLVAGKWFTKFQLLGLRKTGYAG